MLHERPDVAGNTVSRAAQFCCSGTLFTSHIAELPVDGHEGHFRLVGLPYLTEQLFVERRVSGEVYPVSFHLQKDSNGIRCHGPVVCPQRVNPDSFILVGLAPVQLYAPILSDIQLPEFFHTAPRSDELHRRVIGRHLRNPIKIEVIKVGVRRDIIRRRHLCRIDQLRRKPLEAPHSFTAVGEVRVHVYDPSFGILQADPRLSQPADHQLAGFCSHGLYLF